MITRISACSELVRKQLSLFEYLYRYTPCSYQSFIKYIYEKSDILAQSSVISKNEEGSQYFG
jgi:hypothetical protein